jgi:hypothetical protein
VGSWKLGEDSFRYPSEASAVLSSGLLDLVDRKLSNMLVIVATIDSSWLIADWRRLI